MSRLNIVEQLRRNAVALISLVVALTSLGYNTWRNEHSENNRNQRQASFQILSKLGDLQELVFLNHYDCNILLRGNTRTGWVMVQTIEDLTLALEDMAPQSAAGLKDVWQANWQGLEYVDEGACRSRSTERRKQGVKSTETILAAMNGVRKDVLQVLHALD
jgi:hypothetical protein